MDERDKYFIPDRYGGLLTAEQALSKALNIFPETILGMDMPAERRLHLARTIHGAVYRYGRYLSDEGRTIDDFEHTLGESNTFDPFSRAMVENSEKEDLALLS